MEAKRAKEQDELDKYSAEQAQIVLKHEHKCICNCGNEHMTAND